MSIYSCEYRHGCAVCMCVHVRVYLCIVRTVCMEECVLVHIPAYTVVCGGVYMYVYVYCIHGCGVDVCA